MNTVTLQDLQHDPASWLDRVAAGEEVVVARDGQPVAIIAPLRPKAENPPTAVPRPVGLASGTFVVPDDFDNALPDEVLRMFEGR